MQRTTHTAARAIPTKHIKHLVALHHLCAESPSGFQVSTFQRLNLDCHPGEKYAVIQRNANDLLTTILQPCP